MAERKKVIGIRGKEMKEFPSVTHATYFAEYKNPRSLRYLMSIGKRDKNGWKYTLKENLNLK